MRFMTLDPGHFHAALVQKSMYPQVEPDVDIYAPPGFDLDEHVKRIKTFNSRADQPTAWRLHIHPGRGACARMVAERPGDMVVIAGRNRGKIDYVVSSVEAGIHVLADKPWIIRSEDLPRLSHALQLATSRGLVAYDIMTERFEVTNALQRALVNDPAVFGEVVKGTPEEPGVYMKSVHHIMKEVAGVSLRRPAWFFDIGEQGEALTDVGTHLVDLSIWSLFPDRALDHRSDLEVNSARRWPTVLTREQFARVTGEGDFPASLQPWVHDRRLHFFANTAVNYALCGVNVKLDVLWDLESKEHGDTHHAMYRGERARVEVRQGAEEDWRPEVYVVPASAAVKEDVLAAVCHRVVALQERWPGLGVDDRGEEIGVTIPDQHRLGHEAHFAEVADRFLSYVEAPSIFPDWENATMIAKYFITTHGTDLSRRTGE